MPGEDKHALKAQLAVALRDVEMWKMAKVNCAESNRRLRADVKRLRAALENLDAHLDFSEPWEADEHFKDPSGINAAFAQARAALATGGESK